MGSRAEDRRGIAMLDLRQLIEHLGLIAWGVVITLALMSVASFAIAIERYRTFRRAVQSSRQLARDTAALLKAGRLREAAAWCRSAQARHSHVARTLSAGLDEWLATMERGVVQTDRDTAVALAKEAASQMAALEQSDLGRGLVVLATVCRAVRHDLWHHRRVQKHRDHRVGRHHGHFDRYCRGAGDHRVWSTRGSTGRVGLQLPRWPRATHGGGDGPQRL
jgi:hypothetical protein